MSQRRWTAGMTAEVSGLWFRVMPGKKEAGDLRLEWRTGKGWIPISMTALALLVDFFVENETHLMQFRPHWRMTAEQKLFALLQRAVAEGWLIARAELEAERQQVAAPAASWCRAQHPAENVVCTLPPDHSGPHRWNDTYVWPRVAA